MTKLRLVAALAACGVIVAACGSSSKVATTTTAAAPTTAAATTTTAAAPTTAAGDAGLAAAQKVLDQYGTEPTQIPVTEPITAKIPKKTVAWLECNIPTCQAYETPGFKAATAALGWTLKVIPMDSAKPSVAVQQAIDAGVNYIALSGEAYSLYKDQALAAKAKGILMFGMYDTSSPVSVDSNNLTEPGDAKLVNTSYPIGADWTIVDSKSNANVLLVTIPSFAVLKTGADAFKAELTKNCSKCVYNELDATIDDLVGGKIPGQIASQLQSNSKINYVYFGFGDLPGGVLAALKSAGLDKQVKLAGQDFSKSDLPDIISGAQGAWTSDPKQYAAWLTVDAMARAASGMPLADVVTLEQKYSGLISWLVSKPADAQKILDAGGDWFPSALADQFKKLWGV